MMRSRVPVISWSHMRMEGPGGGKDVKLYPGGGQAWDWAETGTRHLPGTGPPTSRSYWRAARPPRCCPRARQGSCTSTRPAATTWSSTASRVHVARTRQAEKINNELAERARLPRLFHSTC